jgi:hypothetical protein
MWKELFAGIGVMLAVILLAVIIRPPKFDATVKANPPSVYIPGFTIMFVIWVVISWRGSRK